MELRLVIADNLKRFMRIAEPPELRTSKGLGLEAKIGRRTVDRMRNPQQYPEHAPNLVNLVAIAAALERDVWELMLPKRKALVQQSDVTEQDLHRGKRRSKS